MGKRLGPERAQNIQVILYFDDIYCFQGEMQMSAHLSEKLKKLTSMREFLGEIVMFFEKMAWDNF